ncbi:hypothetical protein KKF55_04370 [Patescibacteria group bacterium]|nr:hypothetical protein [Patescibacteria group bacterium]
MERAPNTSSFENDVRGALAALGINLTGIGGGDSVGAMMCKYTRAVADNLGRGNQVDMAVLNVLIKIRAQLNPDTENV